MEKENCLNSPNNILGRKIILLEGKYVCKFLKPQCICIFCWLNNQLFFLVLFPWFHDSLTSKKKINTNDSLTIFKHHKSCQKSMILYLNLICTYICISKSMQSDDIYDRITMQARFVKFQPIAKCHHKDHKMYFSFSEPYGNTIDN